METARSSSNPVPLSQGSGENLPAHRGFLARAPLTGKTLARACQLKSRIWVLSPLQWSKSQWCLKTKSSGVHGGVLGTETASQSALLGSPGKPLLASLVLQTTSHYTPEDIQDPDPCMGRTRVVLPRQSEIRFSCQPMHKYSRLSHQLRCSTHTLSLLPFPSNMSGFNNNKNGGARFSIYKIHFLGSYIFKYTVTIKPKTVFLRSAYTVQVITAVFYSLSFAWEDLVHEEIFQVFNVVLFFLNFRWNWTLSPQPWVSTTTHCTSWVTPTWAVTRNTSSVWTWRRLTVRETATLTDPDTANTHCTRPYEEAVWGILWLCWFL